MSTVYVLGAGASFGERMQVQDKSKWTTQYFDYHKHCEVTEAPNPPLINGFFSADYLWDTPAKVEASYEQLVKYIGRHWNIGEPFGTGRWNRVNLESVFTTIAIENEFSALETKTKAKSQLLLNELKRYIQSILAHATLCRFGTYTKALAGQLYEEGDTIINFNYDLLMDQELIEKRSFLYENFCDLVLGYSLFPELSNRYTGNGLYLKMHGSLNWFTCTNTTCRKYNSININQQQDRSLYETGVGSPARCSCCQSEVTSVLIPPLLNKPVMQMSVFRSIWGHALTELRNASRIVVIGYSFPTTDFYADWVFRKAIRDQDYETQVWLVNPATTDEEFKRRMSDIFQRGYDDTIQKYEDVEGLFRKKSD